MNHGSELQAVLCALAAYLLAHPKASDTVDGMQRWWFEEGNLVNFDVLAEVLNIMKERGLMEERVAADGRVRYRRIASDDVLVGLLRDPGCAAA